MKPGAMAILFPGLEIRIGNPNRGNSFSVSFLQEDYPKIQQTLPRPLQAQRSAATNGDRNASRVFDNSFKHADC